MRFNYAKDFPPRAAAALDTLRRVEFKSGDIGLLSEGRTLTLDSVGKTLRVESIFRWEPGREFALHRLVWPKVSLLDAAQIPLFTRD